MTTALGARLRDERKRAGLSQATASRELGVSQVSLSRYELGAVEPDNRTLAALASLYGTELSGLLELTFSVAERREPQPARSNRPTLTPDDLTSQSEWIERMLRDALAPVITELVELRSDYGLLRAAVEMLEGATLKAVDLSAERALNVDKIIEVVRDTQTRSLRIEGLLIDLAAEVRLPSQSDGESGQRAPQHGSGGSLPSEPAEPPAPSLAP